MSDLPVQELATRLDELLKEVRRQGRAAIAAQAAAESCLEAVRARPDAAADRQDEPPPAADDARWLRALIPVADAVDRVARQASALLTPPPRRAPARAGLFQRLLGHPPEPPVESGAGQAALAEGLRVLQAQLEGALRDLGVDVDRRAGGPVDGERQRVVEVRPPRPGERAGTVVEVVRPGYALGAKIVREAEVVIAEEGSK